MRLFTTGLMLTTVPTNCQSVVRCGIGQASAVSAPMRTS